MQEVVTGKRAELLSAEFLKKNNLTIICKNYRIDGGEIDIIARDRHYWVFCEVKFRDDESFASVIEQVQPQQCRRVRHTARHYLLSNNIDEHTAAIRFDVIAIVGQPTKIEWFKDAF
ncbi:YraN family protein [Idiomarina loihiensis]|uniref:YraN family protein n=1 Tax=Idiomarina TaxID=135575 RepID=UPI0002E98723|nr:YraN family protein [Idiomarina sp. 28-8]NWO01678.1 YraN family protein [Idiomarinaceae bacterium]HAS22516.1 YraN family protein [Idiomarina loihiensis]